MLGVVVFKGEEKGLVGISGASALTKNGPQLLR